MPLCALVPIIQDKDWLYGKGNPARGECGMDIPEIHRLARNVTRYGRVSREQRLMLPTKTKQ